MLKRLAWRLLEVTVLVFAALGFCYVPLGERTGYEHVHAFATSPDVREFAVGTLEAARSFRARLRGRLIEIADRLSPPADEDASD